MDEPSLLFKLLNNACQGKPGKLPGMHMVQDTLDLLTLKLSSKSADQGDIVSGLYTDIPNVPTSVSRYAWPTTWSPVVALEDKFQCCQLLVSAETFRHRYQILKNICLVLSWVVMRASSPLATTRLDQTSVLMKRQDHASILRFMMYIVAQI